MAVKNSFPWIFATFAVAAAAWVLAKPSAPKKTRKPLPDEGNIGGFDYFVRHVQGAEQGDRSPTIIFFHGRGGTPQGVEAWVDEVVDYPAHVVIPKGKEKLGNNDAWWLQRAADEDQEALAEAMKHVAQDLKPFLQRVRSSYGPPTVAGHSQGAMLAAALAAVHPKLVKNAVGAAAWLPQGLRSSQTAPVVVVHGMQDNVIPYVRTRDWVHAAPGVSLLSVPGVGHDFADLQDDFAIELERLSQ